MFIINTTMRTHRRILQLSCDSVLLVVDDSLTSSSTWTDETDGTEEIITHLILVRFPSNFVHQSPLPRLSKCVSHFGMNSIFPPTSSEHKFNRPEVPSLSTVYRGRHRSGWRRTWKTERIQVEEFCLTTCPQPTVENTVRVHGNLVLRKNMMERHKNVVTWDSQTEPEPVQGRTECRLDVTDTM